MAYLLAVNRTIRGKLPKDASPGTWARFNDAFENCELTPGQIAAEIRAGHAIAAVHDGRRKVSNWRCAQHIGIDLDNGAIEWDDLVHMPLVADHAAIIHTTASHTREHPRYRVLFLLEEPFFVAGSYAYIVGCMLRAFATADPLCKDASRLFFGAPDCSLLLQPGAVLTSEDLANIVTAWPDDDYDAADYDDPEEATPRAIGFREPIPRPQNGHGHGAIVLPADISARRLDAHSEALLDKIRLAPDGAKWATLQAVSITLGGYMASGYYTRADARQMLRAAIETRRSTVASMEAAYKTIDDGLDYGALSPLWYTRGDDPPAVNTRGDLRRRLIEERIKELEAEILEADMNAVGFDALTVEYSALLDAIRA